MIAARCQMKRVRLYSTTDLVPLVRASVPWTPNRPYRTPAQLCAVSDPKDSGHVIAREEIAFGTLKQLRATGAHRNKEYG